MEFVNGKYVNQSEFILIENCKILFPGKKDIFVDSNAMNFIKK